MRVGYVYVGTLLDYGDVYIVPLYTHLHISEDSLSSPVRPKARELAQHGAPPGWLEESDPAGCVLVRGGRSMLPAMTDHTTYPFLRLICY